MKRARQLFLAACCLWAITATITYLTIDVQHDLVAPRRPPPGAMNYQALLQPKLEEAQNRVAATSLWGIQRNGQPIPPPKSQQQVEAEQKIEWQILGAVVRKKEKYLLIQIDKTPPSAIKEGELLPDASKVIKIGKGFYTVIDDSGAKKTIFTDL